MDADELATYEALDAQQHYGLAQLRRPDAGETRNSSRPPAQHLPNRPRAEFQTGLFPRRALLNQAS